MYYFTREETWIWIATEIIWDMGPLIQHTLQTVELEGVAYISTK